MTRGANSLATLDTTEAAVIDAARALRATPPPPGRMTSTEDMQADDRFYAAYQRLLDVLDRLPEEGL